MPAQRKCAALIHPAIIIIRRRRDRERTAQMWWTSRRKLVLRSTEIGLSLRPNQTVRVRQRRRPFDGVIAIKPLVDKRVILAFRSEATAPILNNDDIAARRKIFVIAKIACHLFSIRQAQQNHRE